MTGNRFSSLPTTEFCGGYHTVQNSSGRAAAMSTAFHARCAKASEAEAKWHTLTPEEQEEVETWKPPTVAELSGGTRLHYVDADTELEVGLANDGGFSVGEDRIGLGHLDFAWAYQGVAYVADIKKSEFTSEADSLQLMAYGFAYAALKKCHSFVCGIWVATDGVWNWGQLVDLDSDEAFTLWERVKHAILNVSDEFSMGPHCRKCYGRFRCPAYLLPPEAAETSLAGLTAEGLDNAKALTLLLLCQRAEDTVKDAKKQLQDYAARVGGIRDGKGKVFLPTMCQGRVALDKAALYAAIPEAATYEKRGASYEQFRWVKEKSK